MEAAKWRLPSRTGLKRERRCLHRSGAVVRIRAWFVIEAGRYTCLLVIIHIIGDFNMLKPQFVEDLSARMSEILASSPARDLEKNLQAMLSAAFTRLNLVTREEFDVQAKVLMRTREKLAVIEQKIAELEQQAQK